MGIRRAAVLLAVFVLTAVGLGGLGLRGPAIARAQGEACPWMNASLSPHRRAQMLLSAMTLAEKIAMVYQPEPDSYHYGAAGWIPAIPSLCVPDVVLNDAGEGVGDQQVGTTAFPAPIAQASSWDTKMQLAVGAAIGKEAFEKGIDDMLAPGIETDRNPMNGRNWEYASEDPYLSGRVGAAEVEGIQSNHVIATIKHFIANSQETDRGTDSSDVDERTLEEMYAPQYQAAIQAGGAGSVMCSYNLINDVYSCQNPFTLGMLDHQFGFDGFVVSDWGATHSPVASAKAGLDMEMSISPGTYYGSALQTAVQNGQMPLAMLNEMVLRVLRTMFRVGLFDHPPRPQPAAYRADVSTRPDVAAARKASEEGTVLLKNDGGVLPLGGRHQTIALIGVPASAAGTENTYNGDGSGHVTNFGDMPLISPQRGITQRAAANGDTVRYADGTVTADAVVAAKAAKVAIVFASDNETEGEDRSSLTMKSGVCELVCVYSPLDQDALISAVAEANPNTIVVLQTGGPVLMPWLSQVKGVFETWYPGEQDGNAIAALLFGDVDPSGRLTETFPASRAEIPLQSKSQWPGVTGSAGITQSHYTEGLLVGYRWYDAKHITPLFPFGYGLDYTSFRYRSMGLEAGGPSPAGDPTLATATIKVTNTGSRAGADVPQMYVADPPSTGEPPKALRGFERVRLDPKKTTISSFPIDRSALTWWDPTTHSWTVSPGCYTVMIGHDERDIAARRTLAVGGASCPGAAAGVLGPGPSGCIGSRSVLVALFDMPTQTIEHVSVYVDGRHLETLRGPHRSLLIRLRGRLRKTYVVRLVITTALVHQVDVRTYRTCAKQ